MINKNKNETTINNAIKAFTKLKQIGCPVYLDDDSEPSYFRISGEYIQKDGSFWVEGYNDYDGEPHIDSRITKILDEHKLEGEFYSSCQLNVYDS
jgi:hypothetical protein